MICEHNPAMCAKQTYKRDGSIVPLLLETGAKRGWVVTAKALSLYLQKRNAVPLYRRLIWSYTTYVANWKIVTRNHQS